MHDDDFDELDVDAMIHAAEVEANKKTDEEKMKEGVDKLLDINARNERLRIGIAEITMDAICLKCGQVADERTWDSENCQDGEGVVYECKCGHCWEGPTLAHYLSQIPEGLA